MKKWTNTYYENNRNKVLKQKKKYYQENKEKCLEQTKKYYQENREKCLEQRKKLYKKKNNPRGYFKDTLLELLNEEK